MASNESQEQDLEPTNPSAAEMNTPTQATGIGLDQLPLPSPTSSEELSLNDTTPLSLHTSEEIHSADLSSQEALESSINIFRAGSLSSSPALDIASPSANVGSAKYSIDTWEISIDTWERDTAYTGSRTVSRGSLWSEGSDRNIRTLEDELSGLNADEEASSPEISQWEDSDEAEDVVLGVTTTSDPFSDSKAVTSSSSDENDDPFADFDGVHREESGSEASTPAQASRSRLARLTIDDSSDDIADMLVGFPEPPQSASSDIFSARGDVEEDDEEGTEFFDRLSRDNSPQVETAKNHFEDLAQDQNSDADDEKEFSDSSPRSPPPRPQSRHGNYDREDDITPPHRARSWHGENEGGASPHSRPDNEHSSPDESDEERRRSWPGDYDESPSPPPRPSSRYDHRDDDNDSPPPRPTSRHSNHDDDNEDERPQTRYGSSDGFGGAPDFSSRFPTMSPYEVESPEGVVSPTEEEDINHAANQTTPERPAKKFDSYMGTGPSSPYSSSEYSPVSPDDESRMSAADRLAWQRQQFQRQVDMLRRMNGDGSNEDGPVYPPKRIAPPRPPRPAEGLDGYDFEFAKPIPRNLEDPEVELQRLRRRDSLDLNIWDSYGRPAEATADDPSGRAQVPSSIQVGEKTYETFTDFDQLSNNYIQENIQTQGQRQLAKLDAEIDDYFAQIDQAWELLLTKLEQRDGELSRGRSKGIGAAKRKILSDLDKDRRGFLSKASELDGKSSAWGKDGKITMTSVSDAFHFRGRPIPDFVKKMEAIKWNDKRMVEAKKQLDQVKKELEQVKKEFHDAKQAIDVLNDELDEIEKERNEYARIANERTEAANTAQAAGVTFQAELQKAADLNQELEEELEKLKALEARLEGESIVNAEDSQSLRAERVRIAKLSEDLKVKNSRIQALEVTQEELEDELRKSIEDRDSLQAALLAQTEGGEKALAIKIVNLQKELDKLREQYSKLESFLENAEQAVVTNYTQHDEELKELTQKFESEKRNLLKQVEDVAPREEVRAIKRQNEQLEKDLLEAHKALAEKKSEYAIQAATLHKLTTEFQLSRDGTPPKEYGGTAFLDITPTTPSKFQREDQDFNKAMENRNLFRELIAKEKRIHELEEEAKSNEPRYKHGKIDLQIARNRIKGLEGEILWLNHNRPNDSQGQITLPTLNGHIVLETTKGKINIPTLSTGEIILDTNKGRITLPIFSEDDGINYEGIEFDPIKRAEKYNKLRMAKALELEREFAMEMAEQKESQDKLRALGVVIEDDGEDWSDYPRCLFPKSEPWVPLTLESTL